MIHFYNPDSGRWEAVDDPDRFDVERILERCEHPAHGAAPIFCSAPAATTPRTSWSSTRAAALTPRDETPVTQALYRNVGPLSSLLRIGCR